METAVVVDVLRSSIAKGKPGGALYELHAVELLSQVRGELFRRNASVDPGEVDDVIIGCVSQAADQAGCPGRFAGLAAGLPEHDPAVTIDRRCGSSQQSVHFAAQGVVAAAYDVVVAGGVESMSRIPMRSSRMGVDPFGPSLAQRYAPGLIPQGVSAELIAAKRGISREKMDEFSARSHRFDVDETIRGTTTAEELATPARSLEAAELSQQFPEISWSVHAGNLSQLADGASMALITSERIAERLDREPIARIRAMSITGPDPMLMQTGPIPATEKLLARSGVAIDDTGHFEVNEAFAAVPLAWQREYGVPDEALNPHGGAIALGHPLGASGTRVLSSMVHGMAGSGVSYGLQVTCKGGVMANAMLVENLRPAMAVA